MWLPLLASTVVGLAGPTGEPPDHALAAQLRALDLRTVSGAAIALQRLTDAAKVYCAGTGAAGGYDVTTLKCRRDMVSRAVQRLGVPEMSAAFEATAFEATATEELPPLRPARRRPGP